MKALKREGRKVMFHCCDNHFPTKHNAHYRRMIAEADCVITPTFSMAEIIKKETGIQAVVIPETYELPEKEPCFKPDGKLKLLWFGHPSNLQDLINILPDLDDHELRICTAMIKPWPGKLDGYQVLPYTADNILSALDWCDAVIIPSSCDERKKVKSANRLMESVRRGKFVVAADLPSYREYDAFMRIYEPHEGIEKELCWLQEQTSEEIEGRIHDAQEYIKTFYAPEVIGRKWEQILC